MGHPNFFYFLPISFTAAEGGGSPNGRPGRPNGGAEGATSPEGEGNPAEGGRSRVYIYIDTRKSAHTDVWTILYTMKLDHSNTHSLHCILSHNYCHEFTFGQPMQFFLCLASMGNYSYCDAMLGNYAIFYSDAVLCRDAILYSDAILYNNAIL